MDGILGGAITARINPDVVAPHRATSKSLRTSGLRWRPDRPPHRPLMRLDCLRVPPPNHQPQQAKSGPFHEGHIGWGGTQGHHHHMSHDIVGTAMAFSTGWTSSLSFSLPLSFPPIGWGVCQKKKDVKGTAYKEIVYSVLWSAYDVKRDKVGNHVITGLRSFTSC